MIHIFTMLAKI